MLTSLRWLLIAACLACVADVAWNARWEARLKTPETTMILHLSVAPLWSPPRVPASHREFLSAWGEGRMVQEIPGAGPVELSAAWDRMLFDLLLRLWPTTLLLGLLYAVARRSSRDLALHLSLHVGCGLTLGAAVSLMLWLALGGWGPPFAGFLGVVGLLGGASTGFWSFRANTVGHGAAVDEVGR